MNNLHAVDMSWAELILFVFNKHWDIMLCRIFVYLKLYIMYIIYEINKRKDLNIKTSQERWRIVEAEEEEYHQTNHSFHSTVRVIYSNGWTDGWAADDCWRHDRMNLLYLFPLISNEGWKGDDDDWWWRYHRPFHRFLVPTPVKYLSELRSSSNSNTPAYIRHENNNQSHQHSTATATTHQQLQFQLKFNSTGGCYTQKCIKTRKKKYKTFGKRKNLNE